MTAITLALVGIGVLQIDRRLRVVAMLLFICALLITITDQAGL